MEREIHFKVLKIVFIGLFPRLQRFKTTLPTLLIVIRNGNPQSRFSALLDERLAGVSVRSASVLRRVLSGNAGRK